MESFEYIRQIVARASNRGDIESGQQSEFFDMAPEIVRADHLQTTVTELAGRLVSKGFEQDIIQVESEE